jgi:hypothetical protein
MVVGDHLVHIRREQLLLPADPEQDVEPADLEECRAPDDCATGDEPEHRGAGQVGRGRQGAVGHLVHLFHATRADLLRRLGRHREATAAHERAAALAPTDAERAFLNHGGRGSR